MTHEAPMEIGTTTNTRLGRARRPIDRGTAASSRLDHQRIEQIGSVELPAPAGPNYINRSFEKALASGREADWERFVDQAAAMAPRASFDEVATLLELALEQSSSYRPAAALVRALSVYAESGWRDFAACGLSALVRHRSPEVRLQALEAAADADEDLARTIAASAVNDPHPEVRRLVQTLLGA